MAFTLLDGLVAHIAPNRGNHFDSTGPDLELHITLLEDPDVRILHHPDTLPFRSPTMRVSEPTLSSPLVLHGGSLYHGMSNIFLKLGPLRLGKICGQSIRKSDYPCI